MGRKLEIPQAKRRRVVRSYKHGRADGACRRGSLRQSEGNHCVQVDELAAGIVLTWQRQLVLALMFVGLRTTTVGALLFGLGDERKLTGTEAQLNSRLSENRH